MDFVLVPREPTEEMWSELARDIVMWDRFPRHNGSDLHSHLKSIGREIPEWLAREIPDTNQVPSKGTVAVCIWKAMLVAAPPPPQQSLITDHGFEGGAVDVYCSKCGHWFNRHGR